MLIVNFHPSPHPSPASNGKQVPLYPPSFLCILLSGCLYEKKASAFVHAEVGIVESCFYFFVCFIFKLAAANERGGD